jgi:hypothetical protein
MLTLIRFKCAESGKSQNIVSTAQKDVRLPYKDI